MNIQCTKCGCVHEENTPCPICKKNDTPRAVYVVASIFAIGMLLFGIGLRFAKTGAVLGAASSCVVQPATPDDPTPTDNIITTESTTESTRRPPQSPPIFTVFGASSIYDKDNYNYAFSQDAFDNDKSTCWQDGVEGYGEGEYLTAEAFYDQLVSGIVFRNGYQKPKYKKYYKLNSRVKKISVTWFDENGIEVTDNPQIFNIQDITDDQKLTFSEPVVTTQIKITILEVYKGSKYADTCISDIMFF